MYSAIAECYDQIFPLNPDVPAFLSRYLARRPARVLDIGCGTGACIAAMAETHDATGIDPNKALISRARQNHPKVPFQETDLFEASIAPGFDLIYCIGNVIAHIDDRRREAFVQRVYDLLLPGGIWIFHTINWEAVLGGTAHDFPVISRTALTFSRRYTDITPDRVRFETTLETPARKPITDSIFLFPLTRERIAALHHAFRPQASVADYTGQLLTNTAAASLFVFERPYA